MTKQETATFLFSLFKQECLESKREMEEVQYFVDLLVDMADFLEIPEALDMMAYNADTRGKELLQNSTLQTNTEN